MFFKLLPKVGNHAETDSDGKVVIYKAEEDRVIETDNDLAKKHPNKFVRVETGLGEEALTEKPDEKPEKPKKPAGKKNPLGKDVTDTQKKDGSPRFPKVQEEDFKVFSKNRTYVITEADDPETPLHEGRLKKSEVGAFIEKYLEE